MSLGTPSTTQNFRFASAALTGAQPMPVQPFFSNPAAGRPIGQSCRQPAVSTQRSGPPLPLIDSGSTIRMPSRIPMGFHSKSSGLPSKKLPSSWLRSEPRKPSERFAGLTAARDGAPARRSTTESRLSGRGSGS